MALADLLTSGLGGLMPGTPVARLIATYQGSDLSSILATNLIEFHYRDPLANESETIEILLSDQDGRFHQSWSFQIATPLTITLEQDNWNIGPIIQVALGTFWIDEIEMDLIPGTLRIRATPLDPSLTVKWQKNSRNWEQSDLKTLASQIASEAKLKLSYQASFNPTIARTDQVERSDLVFLKEQCRYYSLCLRITNGQMIIFDEIEAEAQSPSYTVVYPNPNSGMQGGIENGGILRANLVANAQDTYRNSQVAYHDDESGATNFGSWFDGNAKTGSSLKINERGNVPKSDVSDLGDEENQASGQTGGSWFEPGMANDQGDSAVNAENLRKARAELHAKNKEAHKTRLSLPLDIRMAAALVLALDAPWGPEFSGNWLIEDVQIRFGGNGAGTTNMLLHKCLGYPPTSSTTPASTSGSSGGTDSQSANTSGSPTPSSAQSGIQGS